MARITQQKKGNGGGNDNKKTLLTVSAIVLVGLIGYFIWQSMPKSKSWDGLQDTVIKVNDDGSLELNNGMHVNLLGDAIDSKGVEWMRNNLVGKAVTLTANSDDTQKTYTDASKTTVRAYVTVTGGNDYSKLNRYLLASGMATLSTEYCSDSLQAFRSVIAKDESDKKDETGKNEPDTTHTGKPMTQQELFNHMAPATFLIATPDGGGTGFFINENGVALTNYHVVKGYVNSPESCKVFLSDKNGNINEDRDRPILRNIKWDRQHDWCICVISLDPGEKSHYLDLSKVQARRGDDVCVLGHTRGITNTFTKGIISNIHDEAGAIQFTAEINHGNSGGPVCNMWGEVVGISTLMMSDENGNVATGNINVGVDIMLLRKVLDELDDVPFYGGK